MAARYAVDDLRAAATALLVAGGMDGAFAADVGAILIEGDLLGHDTHGLALLAPYLSELEAGRLRGRGAYRVLNERAGTALWDGERLPGPWLTLRAIDDAIGRARRCGTGTVVIRRSHHIASLAAYLTRATDAGFVLLLTCSDPNSASIAPHGGLTPVFTPDPIAFGVPTSGDPVLIDLSASLTTNGMTARLHHHGRRLAHPWLLDAEGRATDDPAVLFSEPRGTILPAGGLDAGHKGYAMALIVEVLTGALAGHGRADPKEGWGATVAVQVWDPEAFGGREALARQSDWIVAACRGSRPRPGIESVRIPGERGLRLKREQILEGVRLHEDIVPALQPWAARFGIALPAPLAD
ncbi:MAG TPA: Ldh family oxidoreductase [Burkholderiaceae bacterium]|nr:Ldh family oxidoreductase [Burkholderiaceae bacterium]HQR69937.1 Ldh family oxidoreductase [Burkholderiaceae bacterium]